MLPNLNYYNKILYCLILLCAMPCFQRKEKTLIVSIPRKRLKDAVSDDETTPKRFQADIGYVLSLDFMVIV